MEFSRFIGGFGINQIFYKKFQYLNFKKSNKNSGNSAVAIVNKAQPSCKQTNIEKSKSRIRNKSGIFTIIMFFFLDIVQNDWTRIDEDYSCKFQGKKQNEDWPGWSGFGRFCHHKILIAKKIVTKILWNWSAEMDFTNPYFFENFGQNRT